MSGPALAGSVAKGDDFTTRTTPSEPGLSEMESKIYYYGLHSKARLVARTGSAP
jgi:hypothetical protein